MPKSNKDPSILTPKKSIHSYCVNRCQQNGKTIGSKREVVGCLETSCPLYPYRTGMLKARRGEFSQNEKSAKLWAVERARRYARIAEKRLETERQKLEDAKRRNFQKYIDAKNDLEDLRRKLESSIEPQINHVNEAEKILEERRARVERLERKYDEEMMSGLWGDVESEEKKEEPEEETE